MPNYTVEWLNPERTEAIVTETTEKQWPWSRTKIRQAEVFKAELSGYWRFKSTNEFAIEISYLLEEKSKQLAKLELEKRNWTVVSRVELPKAKVVPK